MNARRVDNQVEDCHLPLPFWTVYMRDTFESVFTLEVKHFLLALQKMHATLDLSSLPSALIHYNDKKRNLDTLKHNMLTIIIYMRNSRKNKVEIYE